MSAALLRSEGTAGASGRALGAKAAITETTQAAQPALPAAVTATAATTTAAAPAPPPPPPVAVTVSVVHDGQTQQVTTTATTVGLLLREMGISVGSLDRLAPPASAGLVNGETIRLVRVRQSTTGKYLTVNFTAITQDSSKVELGSQSVQAGVNGQTEQIFQETYLDGQLVSTALAATKVVRPMQPQITYIGTGEPTFVSHGQSQSGLASWYAIGGLTAASLTLPFGTVVHVTDTDNGRTVNVTIDDRGPYTGGGRIIDLSQLAFSQLASPGSGVVPVQIQW
jgi:hypothetical protein